VRAPHELAQAVHLELREHVARMTLLLATIERNTKAANDAGELSAQALAVAEALRRRLDALDANPDGDGDDDDDTAGGGA
jgi:hypothetical protein